MKNADVMKRVLLAGLLAGVFGGLVGLGGGVVMIPLLIAWAGLTRHQAHATSLTAVIATGAVGAATYALRGRVDVPATVVLACAAISAASLGARTAHRIDAGRLRQGFGIFLLVVAVLLAIRPWLGGPTHASFTPTLWSIAALAATGLIAGFIAGLLGVGGGSIMVPGMVLLAGMDQHLAQGTSLLAMVPAAIAGSVTHARAGAVASRVLPALIPGVLLGTVAGATLAQVLPEPILRWSFAAFVAWLGWRDLRASWRRR
jgi:uncharacterized membrane protein YfcA